MISGTFLFLLPLFFSLFFVFLVGVFTRVHLKSIPPHFVIWFACVAGGYPMLRMHALCPSKQYFRGIWNNKRKQRRKERKKEDIRKSGKCHNLGRWEDRQAGRHRVEICHLCSFLFSRSAVFCLRLGVPRSHQKQRTWSTTTDHETRIRKENHLKMEWKQRLRSTKWQTTPLR